MSLQSHNIRRFRQMLDNKSFVERHEGKMVAVYGGYAVLLQHDGMTEKAFYDKLYESGINHGDYIVGVVYEPRL